jgi:hydroxypyruvate isomerase
VGRLIEFSANLGFLWTEKSLPDAIRAAKSAGFSAVECHWPYETSPELVREALDETGLSMLGLNTIRGETGQNGLAALPDRKDEARASIDQAIEYALKIGAKNIHVMAGFNHTVDGRHTFIDNLEYACDQTSAHQITMLIEPLNEYDAPGYFLRTTQQAVEIIEDVGRTNLKLMFDCYHVGRTEGDVTTKLKDLLPVIGHIQFASVPDRGAPDHGDLNYKEIFKAIENTGWDKPIGAEYKPLGLTSDSLNWMNEYL